MKYRVFGTEAEAVAAEAAISKAMGYSKSGVNAKTGKVDLTAQPTVRWAIPQQIADGRWVIPSPDNTGQEAGPDWWPQQEMGK